ncbi:hypothetical protein NPIL_50961, partial [Nephila pilipes]
WQDNARPSTAHNTIKTINRLCYETQENPPYSPRLAPSHFSRFRPFEEALRDHGFDSEIEVTKAVQKRFHD